MKLFVTIVSCLIYVALPIITTAQECKIKEGKIAITYPEKSKFTDKFTKLEKVVGSMKESTSVAFAKTEDQYYFILNITRSVRAIVEIHKSDVLDLYFEGRDDYIRLIPISRFKGLQVANTRSITAFHNLPEADLNIIAENKNDHFRDHFQFKGILKVADNPSDNIGLYYKSEVKKEESREELFQLAYA